MAQQRLTDRELDVMSILWELGSGTVTDVRDRLADRLAYTSVLSALQTLEAKGHIRHTQEGRAYRYHPSVPPARAKGSALARLLDKAFHGSAEALLAQLVSERGVGHDELTRMRTLLEKRLAKEKQK